MATFYWWVDENSAHPGVIQSAESEKNESGKHWVRFSSSSEAHAFVKKLKDKQYEEEKQNERNKQQANAREKAEKRQKNRQQNKTGKTRFHGLYCLLVGWWLAMILVACIVPLFFAGGRRLIKKAFGIW